MSPVCGRSTSSDVHVSLKEVNLSAAEPPAKPVSLCGHGETRQEREQCVHVYRQRSCRLERPSNLGTFVMPTNGNGKIAHVFDSVDLCETLVVFLHVMYVCESNLVTTTLPFTVSPVTYVRVGSSSTISSDAIATFVYLLRVVCVCSPLCLTTATAHAWPVALCVSVCEQSISKTVLVRALQECSKLHSMHVTMYKRRKSCSR